MTKQELKTIIEWEVQKVIREKFPEISEMLIVYDVDSKMLLMDGFKDYIRNYNPQFQLQIMREFFQINDKYDAMYKASKED